MQVVDINMYNDVPATRDMGSDDLKYSSKSLVAIYRREISLQMVSSLADGGCR